MRYISLIILLLWCTDVSAQCTNCLPVGGQGVTRWNKGHQRIDGDTKLSSLAATLNEGDTVILYLTRDSIVRTIDIGAVAADSNVYVTISRLKDSVERLNGYIDSLFAAVASHDSLVKYSDSLDLWVTFSHLIDSANTIRTDLITAINSHVSDLNNPHQVTKSQVGLSNVDNTSDANKPVSIAGLDSLSDHWAQIWTNYVATSGKIPYSDTALYLSTRAFLLANYFANGGNPWAGTWIIGSTTNQPGRIYVNGANVMDYFSGGNVGIGTNGVNNGRKLYVNGTVGTAATIYTTITADNTSPVFYKMTNNGSGTGTGASIEWPFGQRIVASFLPNGFGFYDKNQVDNVSFSASGMSFSLSSVIKTTINNGVLGLYAENGASARVDIKGANGVRIATFFSGNFVDRFVILNDGKTGISSTTITPTSQLDLSATNGYNQLRLRTTYTPTSSADANGNTGDIAWDGTYFYIKTATGWKRSALSSF